MKITFNEVVETLAPAIADKLNYRAVLDMEGHETILIDFSNCGTPFDGDNVVCVWSYQRAVFNDGEWAGSDEVAYGSFDSFMDVFLFVFGQAIVNGSELYVETF